jgi:hypothetical protein
MCVLCACTVRGQIVVYRVLRSVRVVELAVKINYFYPCSIFRLMVYKKFSNNMKARLVFLMMEAAVTFKHC